MYNKLRNVFIKVNFNQAQKLPAAAVFALCISLTSCSITRNVSTAKNNASAKAGSPKFLKGSWNAPGNKVVSKSSSYGYSNAPAPNKNDDNTSVSTDANASSIQNKYAEMMGVQPTDIDNIPLMELIDDWYGTPYVYGGSDKDGIDCSGFSQMLENKIYGQNIPRTSEQQYEHCEHIRKDDLQEGDLVFFHTTRGGYITHVGVYLENNKFVHASSNGVMISDLTDDYWQKTYRASGRIDNAQLDNQSN